MVHKLPLLRVVLATGTTSQCSRGGVCHCNLWSDPTIRSIRWSASSLHVDKTVPQATLNQNRVYVPSFEGFASSLYSTSAGLYWKMRLGASWCCPCDARPEGRDSCLAQQQAEMYAEQPLQRLKFKAFCCYIIISAMLVA